MTYLHRVFKCPFYSYNEFCKIICEGGRLRFRSPEQMKIYCSRYCGSIDGWRKCTIAQATEEGYYDEQD